MNDEVLDLIGIGIGPSNLSLAALLDPHPHVRGRFLEARRRFEWHPGLLFAEAEIQVSHVKDLVTLVDPTSRFSFLSFLHHHRRLYSFLNAGFPRVQRREFCEYLRWVAAQLPSLAFGQQVLSVSFDSTFLVRTETDELRSRNLVLGTGITPVIPGFALRHIGDTVFHASEYLERNPPVAGRRVAVVGGGQTGAEVTFHLLADRAAAPSSLVWVSHRWNFLPLDESAFTNELFTPAYSDFFFGLPAQVRKELIDEQKLVSDGIMPSLGAALYRRLYEHRFLEEGGCRCVLSPGRTLVGLRPTDRGWRLELTQRSTGTSETVVADVIVLCTGYQRRLPACLSGIADLLQSENGEYEVEQDFSVRWSSTNGKIYVQNAARGCRGVADPNLSLMAWRSATIANSVAQRPLYDLEEPSSFIDWGRSDPAIDPCLSEA